MKLAVFGYGSLVSRQSIAETLGHPMPPPIAASLPGWRRRWSLVRDNGTAEKEFERVDGVPFRHVLGLNVERADGAGEDEWPNGALIELSEDELRRLDGREVRYDRVEVSRDFADAGIETDFEEIYAFTAKPGHVASEPPANAIIVAAYVAACRAAFDELGEGEWTRFEATSGPYPAPITDARLVRDAIPPGNPRAW